MENSILSYILVFCLGIIIGIIIGFLIGIFVSKDYLFKLGNLFKNLNIFSNNSKNTTTIKDSKIETNKFVGRDNNE